MDIELVLAQERTRRELPPPSARQRVRERARLSRREVAGALHVSEHAIYSWEVGRRTPSRVIAPAYLELLDRLAAEVRSPRRGEPA